MENKKKQKKISIVALRTNACKAVCEWCNQRSECQFNNGTEGSEPCVQYLAVSKAIK